MAATSGMSTAKAGGKTTTGNHHAIRVLMHEFQSLQKEPMEGFRVKLMKDDNLFEWEVAIFGPPETIYAGGYFRAVMKFPPEYPFAPPTVRFTTKLWHPNIYENGTVCISILHPPTDDPRSGELPCERWNPTQNVHSILMSIISLLNEPNTSSPANVDASIMYRRYKEKGDPDYERMVKDQVEASKAEAVRDNVKIPTTVDEYCVARKVVKEVKNPSNDFADFGISDQEEDNGSDYSFSSDEPAETSAPFVSKRKEEENGENPVSSASTNKRTKSDEARPDRT